MSINKQLRTDAAGQHGYFTARQAVAAGYGTSLQNYHLRTGDWQRVDRALFRLNGYPDTLESIYTRWSLWATGQGGRRTVAISHESALHYYKLVTERPAQVQISVSSLKRQSEARGCQLHLEPLEWGQYLQKTGFCMTTPAYTLKQMRPDLVLGGRWDQTLRQALRTGLLSNDEARRLGWVPEGEHREYTRPEEDQWRADAGAREGTAMYNLNWRVSMHESGGRIPNRSFTLVEVMVVIMIVCILAGLLMPALMRSVDAAKALQCASQLRQQEVGIQQYLSDYNGLFPQQGTLTAANGWDATATWFGAICQYIDWNKAVKPSYPEPAGNTIGHCPNHFEQPRSFSYQGNRYLFPSNNTVCHLASVHSPSLIISVFEAHTTSQWPGTGSLYSGIGKWPFFPVYFNPAHPNGCNDLFVDGHAALTSNGLTTYGVDTKYWIP